jgi:hypothetical protein
LSESCFRPSLVVSFFFIYFSCTPGLTVNRNGFLEVANGKTKKKICCKQKVFFRRHIRLQTKHIGHGQF